LADLHFASATELVGQLRSGDLSSSELLDHFLSRIKAHNPALNAVIAIDADRARAEADAADQARARGEALGLLHGLPVTVKDQFDTLGMRTTLGMRKLAKRVSDRDALSVARLRAAGAIVFAHTNMAEGGIDVQTHNPVFGTTNNPWDLSRTPGGSSGGSAAAMAAGLSGLELGGDIGGSIRTPAHYCGVYGHKPSFRLVADPPHPNSQPGFRTELDIQAPGPLARSADDLELALDVIAGPDPADSVAWHLELPEPRHTSIQGYRIAAWLDDEACPSEPEVLDVLRRAVEGLRREGVRVDEEARPGFALEDAFSDYLRLLFAAIPHGMPLASSRFGRALSPLAASAPGKTHFAQAARGAAIRHADWILANEGRQEYRRAWERFFKSYDVLLCPVTPGVAIPHDHRYGPFIIFRDMPSANGRRPYMDQLVWVGAVGMAYLPATVAPIGRTERGLPVGVQIVGPYLEDRTPIDVARRLASIAGGFEPPPGY
jgi:amidase